MAIAKHNVRFKATLHEDLDKIIKQQAELQGVAASQLVTFIVESHFQNLNLYTPEQSEWRTKLKNQAV